MAEVENEAKCRRCQELRFDQPYEVYDDQGLCIYHSEKEGKERDFPEAKELLQRGVYDFRGFVFPKDVVFSDVDFSSVKFNGEANFNGAEFKGRAIFWKANFKRADFTGAKFEKAYFSEATFHDADFSFAAFMGITNFSRARFKAAADFRGGVDMEEDDQEKEYELFSRKDDTLFLRVAFERPELVYFYRVNLSRCRFLDTDLKSVNFIGITHWHQEGWRAALYDEIHDDSRERYPELMELYRQLKQNYEERRNWEVAGHFHFGQMEMQRRDKNRPLREKFLLKIYRFLSGYGVR